jgi:hypothetical protein
VGSPRRRQTHQCRDAHRSELSCDILCRPSGSSRRPVERPFAHWRVESRNGMEDAKTGVSAQPTDDRARNERKLLPLTGETPIFVGGSGADHTVPAVPLLGTLQARQLE